MSNKESILFSKTCNWCQDSGRSFDLKQYNYFGLFGSNCLVKGLNNFLGRAYIRKAFLVATYSFSKCKTLVWMSFKICQYVEGHSLPVISIWPFNFIYFMLKFTGILRQNTLKKRRPEKEMSISYNSELPLTKGTMNC